MNAISEGFSLFFDLVNVQRAARMIDVKLQLITWSFEFWVSCICKGATVMLLGPK